MLSLIGHYDSPFVRRVGISLHLLGMPFERQLLSVFSNADALRTYNPWAASRCSCWMTVNVWSTAAAILDHLDQAVGPERALVPAGGKARDALQVIALATGLNDKAVAVTYERRKAAGKVDESWIARCRSQQDSVLVALENRIGAGSPSNARPMQPEITVTTALGYLRLRQPEILPSGRYPALEALSAWAESQPAFKACLPTLDEIGGPPQEAQTALLRLRGDPSLA